VVEDIVVTSLYFILSYLWPTDASFEDIRGTKKNIYDFSLII
jgi:hypothetical protein